MGAVGLASVKRSISTRHAPGTSMSLAASVHCTGHDPVVCGPGSAPVHEISSPPGLRARTVALVTSVRSWPVEVTVTSG